jgi:chromosome segregation ATPase
MSDEDLRKRVAQAEQEAAGAATRAADAGRALLDAEARAAADRAAAALAEDALTDARSALAAAAQREDELRAEIARLERVLEQHREWLVSIQSSTSWKITKPLRSLSR